jgi:hypothetical protein
VLGARTAPHTAAPAAPAAAAARPRARAGDRPAVFPRGLAPRLHNRANVRGERGRHAEALAALEEAVALRRGLSRERPDAFTPALAGSLCNLGVRLAAAGRETEALAASAEALQRLVPHLERGGRARATLAPLGRTVSTSYVERAQALGEKPDALLVWRALQALERM